MMIFSKHIVFDVSCKRRRFAGNIKAHFLGIIIIKKKYLQNLSAENFTRHAKR